MDDAYSIMLSLPIISYAQLSVTILLKDVEKKKHLKMFKKMISATINWPGKTSSSTNLH